MVEVSLTAIFSLTSRMDESIEDIDDSHSTYIPKRRRLDKPIRDGRVDQPWTIKYIASVRDELCINPTKLKQLEAIITSMRAKRQRILVVSGPAGSGKSTAVEYIAKHTLKVPIVEFFDRTGRIDEFSEFLEDCQYLRGANPGIVMVEEFPNVFHLPVLASFRKLLRQWLHVDVGALNLPLLVLIMTEVEYGSSGVYLIDHLFTPTTVLGLELKSEITEVKFNPVAVRFTTKLLKRVCEKESRVLGKLPKTKVAQFVKEMATVGDVRSILANFETWARLEVVSTDNLLMFIRESSLNVFHAVGKIIHGSSSGDDYTAVEQVETQFNDDYNLVNLGVLENYHIYRNGDIPMDSAASLVDYLSQADLLLSIFTRQVGLRGSRTVLTLLPKPTSVHSKQMTFPRHARAFRLANKCREQLWQYKWYGRELVHATVGIDSLNLVDGALLGDLLNKKAPKPYQYGRLGGRLRTVATTGEVDTGEATILEVDQFVLDTKAGMVVEESEGELSDPISDEEVAVDSDDFDFSDDEAFLAITQTR